MNIPILFLAVAFAWMLQLILSLLQTKRFHKRIAELRKEGAMTSVGVSGRNWNLKKYGVLVVNDDRVIIRAQQLSGFTVFANLKDVPELAGKPLSVLEASSPLPGIKKKLWAAFGNARDFIVRHDEKAAREDQQELDEKGAAGLATTS